MTDNAKAYIDSLVGQVFQNRWDREQKFLNIALDSATSDFIARGTLRSGLYAKKIGQLHGEFLFRVIDQTLDQLELDFRQSGRSDGVFFWNVTDEVTRELVEPKRILLNNYSVDYCKRRMKNAVGLSTFAAQGFCEYGDQAPHYIGSRTKELTLRNQVVTMKSAADRKANSIPDVAVMMWFPSEKEHGAVKVRSAFEKYAAIVEAVKESSKGLATVDKIDNPSLVHKDRISPSVETWLSKSVLVICDLEENRPNVFYEFGFARARGTDVIATCPNGSKTDFHLNQWNIDHYANWAELKQKLIPRISSVLSKYDLSGRP